MEAIILCMKEIQSFGFKMGGNSRETPAHLRWFYMFKVVLLESTDVCYAMLRVASVIIHFSLDYSSAVSSVIRIAQTKNTGVGSHLLPQGSAS